MKCEKPPHDFRVPHVCNAPSEDPGLSLFSWYHSDVAVPKSEFDGRTRYCETLIDNARKGLAELDAIAHLVVP